MGGGGGCCIGDFGKIISGVIEGASNVVDGIKSIFCSDSCCVGNCCVGNAPGPTESELHARTVANELAEMKTKKEEATSKKESEIMDYINRSLNSFLREIRTLNQNDYGGKKLNINLDLIKKKNDELKSHVVGCIGNVLNKRLVQTDKELGIILEERDDKKRKKNFDSFVDRVQKEALKQFKKEIEETVNQQSELVKKEISARLNEVNKSMEESIQEYTSILESKKKDSQELEKKQVEYMYQSSLCDLLLYEAEG